VEVAPEEEEVVPEVAEPEPAYQQRDVTLATRYLAKQLGMLGQQSLDAKRERWRQLFM
jgi:hypothetical protein